MALILHITRPEAWEQVRQNGFYHGDTLATEGFIHCSTPQQVIRTANALFTGQPNLILLCIQSDLVKAAIHYESVEGGEQFPHIYGPLNADAVVDVIAFPPDTDGTFSLPAALLQHLR
ncbi:MAG: DUF952 domain-containing protein [Chloroflexales bacterium]|nr:DUF952 domain-containing protein [Chloroflexales bacterium]